MPYRLLARTHLTVSSAVLVAFSAALWWAQTNLGQGFLPHGYCLTWIPALMWLHIASDSLIALAYLSIPVTLWIVARRRRDLPFGWMLALFGSFIVACGATHAFDVWTLWNADYWLSGGVKAITAAISAGTAVVLASVTPRLLAIPSVAQLQQAKEALEQEVAARRGAESKLREAQAQLQERVLQRTAALEETTALLNAVWDATPVGLAIFDQANRYVRVNSTLARINGVPAPAHEGMTLADVVPALAAEVAGQLNEARTAQSALVGIEVVGPTPGNTSRATYRLAYFPVQQGPEGGLIGVVCEDITSQRMAEAERARALKDAQAANRMKDEFMARVSHELRTPLQVMSLSVAVLRAGRADAGSAARALERLDHSVRMQARMINDLLDVANVLSARVRLEISRVDPDQAVARSLEGHAEEARARGVELHRIAPGEVASVDADLQRLEQVINNLVSNAIKYTPMAGRVEVVSSCTADVWQLTVTDTGIGIDSTELDSVFEPFRRGAAAETAHRQGLGLGLAIARSIVEQLGGQLTVASEGRGCGAAFRVTLRRSEVPEPIVGQSSELPPLALAGLRILLVEDEPDIADGMLQVLEGFGAQVHKAADLREALTTAEAYPPDVLVSDLQLANGSTGHDVLRALRTTRPDLPAVACTAFGAASALHGSRTAGFHAHLVKPVEAATLAEAILKSLRGSP